jgi:acyl-CoA thioesterase FadM
MDLTGNPTLEGLTMILARAELDYRSPARFGEALRIAVWCPRTGKTSFDLLFQVKEAKTGRLVLEAKKVLVHYDYAAGTPVPLPPDLRDRLEGKP